MDLLIKIGLAGFLFFLYLGAVPGLFAIMTIVDAHGNTQKIVDWSAVLLAIFLGCFLGYGLIRDARKKLRAMNSRDA